MKYRVKHNNDKTFDVQYKKHWYSFWTTCDNYDKIEDAYVALLEYQSDNQCTLSKQVKFTHNRDKTKKVICYLEMGKLNTDKHGDYPDGNYYAGYRPKNYARFYFCSYGKTYENAIYNLWSDLEYRRILDKIFMVKDSNGEEYSTDLKYFEDEIYETMQIPKDRFNQD